MTLAKSMLFMIIVTTITVACAPAPTRPEDVVVDRGLQPTTQEAEQAIRGLLARVLKDPDSVKQFQILKVVPITWYQGLLAGGKYEEGWMVCFEYNAKNSYGGYIGLKTDRVAMRNGSIVQANWALINAGC